jgi:hypothetical protein
VALQFEARKVALKQDRTGFILTLSVHPDEIPEELMRDFVGARYACALVRIQDDESPTPYNNRVQQAAILCKRETFWDFLGSPENEDEAAEALCKYLGITSRSELNGNKVAQERFDEMVKRYEATNDPFQ